MLEDFDRLTDLVMEYIAGLNRSGRMVINYAACFRELRAYLLERQISYSPETAERWLGEIEGQTKKMKFNFFHRPALKMLKEMYLNGEIKTEHHEFSFQTDKELNEEFLAVRRNFSEWLEEKSRVTAMNESRDCSRILLDMQNAGAHSVSEITYDTLIGELSLIDEETYHTKISDHTTLRLLVNFLHERGLAPYGYTLVIDHIAHGSEIHMIRLTGEEKPNLEKAAESDKTASLEEYLRVRDRICAEHVKENYSNCALSTVRAAMDEFYLFLEMNGLRYSPACGDAWLEKIKSLINTDEYMTRRRAVSLIRECFNGTRFRLGSNFVFRETALSRLPSWCREDVENFLDVKKNEGLAKSTMNMYRSSICRFCDLLDKAGTRDFASLTPEDIKRFNATDVHSTPKGKNAYNTRIRRFLEYLGDAGKLSNRYLYLSLPSVCAKREHIVTVLTEDEKRQVTEALDKDNTSISLRDKAMISLGLYMGLRGCDVVKLSIDDIDWDACTIRVLQDKTDKEILLPMPTKVANALYRYITLERPVSLEKRVFLRKLAPFRPATKEICKKALKHVLPERCIPGSGFHVLRKTYATNLLRNDAGVQEVAEALGHSDLSTVDKYLSLDEERMRECAFSLEKMGIAYKGGF